MWIKGGRILDPAGGTDVVGDVFLDEGRIKGIFPGGTPKATGDLIDAAGCWVIPGLIDMHVHLREPGYEYKEDIESGTRAAAAGGVTTLVCMANTQPVNDNPAVTEYILKRARAKGCVRVLPAGAVTVGLKGEELAEIGLMREAGIVAISDDGRPIEQAVLLRRALEYAATFGVLLMSHPQDLGLCGAGVMHEGALSSALGLEGIPAIAEDIMVARDILVAEYTKVPIHLTHLSTQGSLEIVRRAKARGVQVSCDVTPHHLLLTEACVCGYDTNAKMYPPLRAEEDRRALIAGLKDGTIDCIATDHAPHARDEKDLDFDLAPFGTIGLETLLPALITLQGEEGLDLLDLLARVSSRPAGLLAFDGGRLQEGARADITIVDPAKAWTLSEDGIHSKSKNSAFLGRTFTGKVMATVVEGVLVYEAR